MPAMWPHRNPDGRAAARTFGRFVVVLSVETILLAAAAFWVLTFNSTHWFPSGHATAAYAFFGGRFMLRDAHPRTARARLAGVLVLGIAFGAAQIARGARYPSHALWSGWLCWVCQVAAAPRRRDPLAFSPPVPAPATATMSWKTLVGRR
jgi:hypothetical protein